MTWGGISSIAIRQAIISTIFMLITIALVALAARATVDRQQRAALLGTIDTDIAGLVDGMADGGLPRIVGRIDDRIALKDGSEAGYWLGDAKGNRIVDNLSGTGSLDPARSQNAALATPDGPALARATLLRGGLTLIVTRSLRPVDLVLHRLTVLFALAAIPTTLASLLVGALSARHFSRRIVALNEAFDRFEAGDLSVRSGATRPRDEIGRLSAYVDGHLARTARLISVQRQVSDNIAHELRTPLSHLDARLLAMLVQVADPAMKEDLHRARDDIRTIVSLFDALLDLALAEATGGKGTGATVFDLSEQIADLVELYAPSAEEAGLDFTVRITPAVMMRGEPMAMSRAVANLLDNAFKFTSAGSHVRLTITEGPRIVVEDDGPGVAPDMRQRLFERFHGLRDQQNGHGLGLALVKVIALRHGLTARFEDAAPGARFILEPAATS